MKRFLLIPLLFLPLSAGATAYPEVPSSTPPDLYIAQPQVSITEALPADLVSGAGTVLVSAPVGGEILAAGGTVTVMQGAGGNVRALGGKVTVNGDVGGDVAVAGATVHVNGTSRNIYAAGGSVDLEGGTRGKATVYGVNVFLSGDYAGDVTVIASNRLTIGQSTHIHGVLKYSAPTELTVPEGAQLDGGARYTGAYAYVPTNQQIHQYATIGSILFFAVRVLAGVVVAGLIAGLFPSFSENVTGILMRKDIFWLVRIFLLGLALAVLVPLLCVILLVSFVGAELALFLIVFYVALFLVAYAFAGITVGKLLRAFAFHRLDEGHELTWQDAAAGTALLSIVGLIPMLGMLTLFVLTIGCAGALALYMYQHAFNH